MYGMTNSRNLFSNELADWLINEAGFKKYQYEMSIYYKYAPCVKKISFYLMFVIVYIGIHMKLFENGLWTL